MVGAVSLDFQPQKGKTLAKTTSNLILSNFGDCRAYEAKTTAGFGGVSLRPSFIEGVQEVVSGFPAIFLWLVTKKRLPDLAT